MGYDEAVFTEHALKKLQRRKISIDLVREVLSNPEQDRLVRPGRRLVQGRVFWGMPPHPYLMRVFVDVDRHPAEVVTVYCTSKFAKYEA